MTSRFIHVVNSMKSFNVSHAMVYYTLYILQLIKVYYHVLCLVACDIQHEVDRLSKYLVAFKKQDRKVKE